MLQKIGAEVTKGPLVIGPDSGLLNLEIYHEFDQVCR